MAFQVSPSIKVNEIDLTAIVPAVSSTRQPDGLREPGAPAVLQGREGVGTP